MAGPWTIRSYCRQMANSHSNLLSRVVALLLTLLFASSLYADWRPYRARYEVYRNGKLTGELLVAFEQNGERWNMSSEGTGTHGIARFLRAKENEYAEGSLNRGRFQSISYSYFKRMAGKDDVWTAGFDWQKGTVAVTSGRNTLTLDTGPNTMDALTLKVELRRRLRDHDPDLVFMQVDDDKVKEMVYRILDTGEIDTALGCLQTVAVERIQLGRTRYSRSWHAQDLDFIMVRLEHGKSNGDDIEFRITELEFGRMQMEPGRECSTAQADG